MHPGEVTAIVLGVALARAGAAFAQEGAPAPPASQVAQSEVAAPDEAAIRAARLRYERGLAFFRADRFEEAIAEFDEAWSLWHNPVVLYGLAQAHERLVHVPRAIHFYQRFLELAAPDAPLRDSAAESVRGLRSLMAELRVESNVPAQVFVNDEAVGEAPGVVQLAIGRYEVELRAEGYVPLRQRATVAAGTHRTLRFVLGRPPEASRERGAHPAWFWTSVGLTTASAVTAATLGVLTVRASNAYAADPRRTPAMQADGERLALATDLTLGAAVLFGVATVVLGLNTAWGAAAPRTALVVDPRGAVAVAGSF